MTVVHSHITQLNELGYVALPGFMEPAFLARLRSEVDTLFEKEGDQAGSEYKQELGSQRLANLVDKAEIFREMILNERLLKYVRLVLGSKIKLSSLNARRVTPHWGEVQPLHTDMSALPDEKGYWVCNTLWMLDDFTPDNGPLRLVPGSHHSGQLPRDVLPDPKAVHPNEIMVTGQAGTVVVLNAHTWHGGAANRTDNSRTAVHAFYARRDKPQQLHQKQFLRPETQTALSPELRDLLALDDSLNDQLSSKVDIRSGFMK
jgi:ectoine hydroxylase-related dioxygenase (phytanoyl-CoA dioxygenase family)